MAKLLFIAILLYCTEYTCALDSSSLKDKLYKRKISGISLEKRIQELSVKDRMKIIENIGENKNFDKNIFIGRKNVFSEDRDCKNREDSFRSKAIPRYFIPLPLM